MTGFRSLAPFGAIGIGRNSGVLAALGLRLCLFGDLRFIVLIELSA